MTPDLTPQHDRLFDLLATRATQALSVREADELESLLNERDDVDELALDRAAAALDLARMPRPEPLPQALRRRVESDAVRFLARSRGISLAEPAPESSPAARPNRRALPWLVAAAGILLALLARFPRAPVEPSAADLYQQLAAAPAASVAAWNDATSAGVTGDIVWDQASQRGVMRLRGLAPNDPARMQYQLWIFDRSRAAPDDTGVAFDAVDGGVFDVQAVGADVYVLVNAKLPVFDPTLFAVTTEPPGGVVKHVTRGDYRVILTAPIPGKA